MKHEFHKVQLSLEVPMPGGNPGVATSTGSFYTTDRGFSISYDDSTQLVTISKEGDQQVVHVSKVNSFVPFKAEEDKPVGKPLKKTA